MVGLSIFYTAIAVLLLAPFLRQSDESSESSRGWAAFNITLAIALLATLPYLNKAFHIDDAVVLQAASNIIEDPLDPFAGEFDWFGELRPLFKTTTNPPALSYYLAPFLHVFGQCEIALHSAMVLFVVMMGLGALMLSRRFCGGSIWPVVFLLASPSVVASGNLMRDVPAAGLATLGVALFVWGVDRDRLSGLFWGAVLCGLAALTKYSSAIVLPVLMAYPILQGKFLQSLWVWPAAALIGLWCLQNQLVYGDVHIVYLLLERTGEAGLSWQDKLYGAWLIAGASLFLLPLLLIRALWSKDILAVIVVIAATVGGWFAIVAYMGEIDDIEYFTWALSGAGLIALVLWHGLARGAVWLVKRSDSSRLDDVFLAIWVIAPLAFSVALVPFQAVRHVIPALPPLVLLALRYFGAASPRFQSAMKPLLIALFAFQFCMASVVQFADMDYADSYRDFARVAQERFTERDVYYVGHWGWTLYAEEAGFQKIRKGEFPPPGAILIVPYRIDKGIVFEDRPDILNRQTLIDSVEYAGDIPIRTQNFWGAGFYGTISIWGRNIPYRLFQDEFLERFDIYEIQSVDSPETD